LSIEIINHRFKYDSIPQCYQSLRWEVESPSIPNISKKKIPHDRFYLITKIINIIKIRQMKNVV